MARPKKKKIEISEQSFLSIAQETYNELVEQRRVAIKQINENKSKVEVSDTHDVSALNKVNTDLLKIVDNTIDKKLNILKMMSPLVFKNDTSGNSSSKNTSEITQEDMDLIQSLFNDGDKKEDDGKDYEVK